MSVARLRRQLPFQLEYDQRFHRPVASAISPRHNSRAVEGSGTSARLYHRPPEMAWYPVPVGVFETQLLLSHPQLVIEPSEARAIL